MGTFSLIVLFAAGIVAVIVEMLIPGMIVGICGALCIITSIVYAYYNGFTTLGHLLLGISIFSMPILALIWYKIFSRTLANSETEKGFTSADEELKKLISEEGITLTTLHPSGIVLFEGKRVDVVTEGSMIEKDKKVVVCTVEGNRVVVKLVKE